MISGYSSLTNNLDKTSELISDVESAPKEQLSGIEQINDAIMGLDTQTQSNVQVATSANDVALETDKIARMIVQNVDENDFKGKNNVNANNLNTEINNSQFSSENENEINA